MISLFYSFQSRKTALILKQKESERILTKEFTESQIEIREETLKNISWELHDNIGQLLTLAKIQIQNITPETPALVETQEIISKSLSELRILSKVINPEFINTISLHEAIEIEINRLNRLNFIKASFVTQGDEFLLDKKEEIIIFRMLQEFFSNTIKHAQASQLEVSIVYNENTILFQAKDDGVGFDVSKGKNIGIGLQSMKNRGVLIGADVNLESEINKGTSISITYKKNHENI